MPRAKKAFVRREFHGNRYAHREKAKGCPRPNEIPNAERASSSTSKLSRFSLCFQEEDVLQSSSQYALMDMDGICAAITQICVCRECGGSVELIEIVTKRVGVASVYSLNCEVCSAAQRFETSKKTTSGLYEANLRLVYALRSIGKGMAAGNILCAMLNLPKPPTKFAKYNQELLGHIEAAAQESMKRAADEAVQLNEGDKDIAVALDGSWQKRGHTSNNGIVSATSVDSGKVLDVEVLSKRCPKCSIKGTNSDPLHREVCQSNYQGTSGGMEVAGALKIFGRSEELHGVRYVKYLGDGDSKAFMAVKAQMPYGDSVEISKVECIGHVQKRMGTRLRRLKKGNKAGKLSDGKSLSGRGRLTDAVIDKLQTYYGLAIRRNVGNLDEMRKAVWATFFHLSATDDDPCHGLCPKGPDTWCAFNRSQSEGKPFFHKESLPASVLEAIKPIYRELSKAELLEKCLHGRTQNANESFNHVVWERAPKNVFVRLRTLRMATLDAVLSFNDGSIARANVLKACGLNPGSNTIKWLREADHKRMYFADRATRQLTKEARQSKRQAEKRKNDGDSDYEAGGY